jgi:uncharacterized protein (UPF0332 family)
VTPEAADYLDKARRTLEEARAVLAIGLSEPAGRPAYLDAMHAAQAVTFHRTGRVAKTHGGVRSEFARLTKDEPVIGRGLSTFLAEAYVLKQVADYETGPEAAVPRDRASMAIDTAARFVECVTRVVAEPKVGGDQSGDNTG